MTWYNPVSWIIKGVVAVGDKIIEGKKVWSGSQQERDQQASGEQIAVISAQAAEFAPRENRTWWDSLIDGLNRLVRPIFTFGTIALFVWAVQDPVEFALSMRALAVVPDSMWVMMFTIVGFWFGTKFLSPMVAAGKGFSIDPEKVALAVQISLDNKEREKAEAEALKAAEVAEIPEENTPSKGVAGAS